MKKRWLKGIWFVLVLTIIALVSGCSAGGGQSSEKDGSKDTQENDIRDNAIFDLYNQIDINDKKADIEKDLGATGNTSAEGSYVYLDPDTGYAVNVFFNAKDLVTLKVLVPTTGARELIELSNASVTKEVAAKISQGMTQSNVKKALTGQGIEMLRMVIPSGADKEAYALAWINADGSVLVVTFDSDTNTVLAAEFKESLF
ncbi:hypothetical protein [Acetobacterium wieringae]|uniref:Uncharacterized protein n=1 Tax=Acetobacterium wieringae TaxID=52694 RepID=A0A5D0WKL5_9FIRM|nr:hypothetical protein [Acetobacterium wieringae]TYC84709.1 hypothetical protein FXB42_10230 [Acetobacterium wieringae]URN85589.1 hypothetical protein CHL1_001253 [Acetobacterium wieringae]